MLADVLGIEISLGSTQKAWEEVSQAVSPPVRQLQEQLPHQAVLNIDETGWRTNGDKRWIWALVAQQFVFYVVASTRGAEVLVSLLGTVFRGILCSDRWVVYLTYHSGRMQLCWAHLKRNILGIAEYARSPSAQQFCRDALAIVARLFRLWYRFRGDLRDRRGNPQPLDRRQLLEKSIPLQKKLFTLAQAHLDDADGEVRNLATALFVHFDRLFTFLQEEGVEPTNNVAERVLRTAVQWRKISFGNRSRNGEIATARLLTVTQTCKRQQRHVLGYLTDAVRCHRSHATAPLSSRNNADHVNCCLWVSHRLLVLGEDVEQENRNVCASEERYYPVSRHFSPCPFERTAPCAHRPFLRSPRRPMGERQSKSRWRAALRRVVPTDRASLRNAGVSTTV